MTNTTYRLEDVIRRIQQQIRDDDMPQKVYRSMDGFSRLANAIVTTRGDQWASQLIDENGRPLLSPAEQEQFTRVFRPYTGAILDTLKQSGGANETKEAEEDVNRLQVADMMNVTPTQLNAMRQQATSGAYDPEKATGIDETYLSIMDKIHSANTSVNHFASQYGVLRLEKESDLDTDVRIVPKALSALISSGVGLISPPLKIPTQAFLEKVKVPFRLIVTAIYLFLDITRITVTLQGQDNQRRTLTLMIALLEFLRGDWKKAALTFMGYYGSSSMWLGQMGKIYLTMFHTLSPTLQDQITYGALDVTKSFLIGILLAVFKIAAPEEIRLPLIGVLQKIAAKKATIDGILTDSGLPPREDYFAPSFQDLNNIQSLMDDPDFVCSCEYEELMKNADKSAILHVIFQMMRLPVTREYRQKYQCGTGPCKTFVESLVATGKEKQKRMTGEKNIESTEKKTSEDETRANELSKDETTEKTQEESTDEITPVGALATGAVVGNQVASNTLPPTITPVTASSNEPLPPTITPVAKNTASSNQLPPTITPVTTASSEQTKTVAAPLPPTIGGQRRPRRLIYGPHA